MYSSGGINVKNDKIKISINGEENSKSEIVYNNIIDNLKLSEEEQVKYLKNKVAHLEMEMKNRLLTLILIIISLIGIGFGLYFMYIDLYLLGALCIIATFILVALKFHFMYKSIIKLSRDLEFDKIEHLRKILNTTLK